MTYNSAHKLPANKSETGEFMTSFNVETIETVGAFDNAKGGSISIGVTVDASVTGVSLEKKPRKLGKCNQKQNSALYNSRC
jgi:predicted HTH transcriptional regulator